jgi:hypothetical protein
MTERHKDRKDRKTERQKRQKDRKTERQKDMKAERLGCERCFFGIVDST